MAKNSRKGPIGKRCLVLLAEDHDISRRHLLNKIASASVDTLHARNGHLAVQMALQKHPDLVLMDFHLPDMSGLEAIESIQQLWPTALKKPVFVVISAHDLSDCLPQLEILNVRQTLQKPVDGRQLNTLIANISGKADKDPGPSCSGEFKSLFLAELQERLPKLDRYVLNYELNRASAVVHQLRASSAMAGEHHLNSALQSLERLLLDQAPAEQLAGSYLKMVELAHDSLCRFGPARSGGNDPVLHLPDSGFQANKY